MRIKVKLDNQLFEVEIDDLRARPIVAYVEGEAFEVWPEVEARSTAAPANRADPLAQPPTSQQASGSASSAAVPSFPPAISPAHRPAPSAGGLMQVRAPIPGVITTVDVREGDSVTVGQQLCVLEAMKMNNSIRASRSGRIGAIHVSAGQHVKHHDVLIEFSE